VLAKIEGEESSRTELERSGDVEQVRCTQP
jgi:hypothetical protein